uniref:Uncharacterized protein n=1 Tax=Oryza rufipogon TaxID=4529 RepID=A0A0E0Q895_ORYRU
MGRKREGDGSSSGRGIAGGRRAEEDWRRGAQRAEEARHGRSVAGRRSRGIGGGVAGGEWRERSVAGRRSRGIGGAVTGGRGAEELRYRRRGRERSRRGGAQKRRGRPGGVGPWSGRGGQAASVRGAAGRRRGAVGGAAGRRGRRSGGAGGDSGALSLHIHHLSASTPMVARVRLGGEQLRMA